MKKTVLFFLLACGVAFANAQTLILGSASSPQSGCALTVFDNGGENGNYTANRDDRLTIHSNSTDPSLSAVQVTINLSHFNVHPSDTLFIYDGPNVVDSMLLAALNDSLVTEYGTTTISFAATMRNLSGDITIRFKTDGSNEGGGFEINTSCTKLCQRINIAFDRVHSNKYPILQDDGYYYLDVCPGETVHLVARGMYPDNNVNYTQSDQTCTFVWDLGVETFDSLGMTTLDYTFPEGRGYDVSLLIKDQIDCESTNRRTFRVRTSSNPVRELVGFPDVCTGDTIDLTYGYDESSHIQVDTIKHEQLTTLAVADTIFLPDGIPCNGTCSYLSPVTFTAFSPNAKITSVNDIFYVQLAIEHSYIGDIWIRLICPNGQYSSIMKWSGSGSAQCSSQIPQSARGWNASGSSYSFFGQYYEPDGSDKCDPNQNTMGTCWNYCWSNNTTQGYSYACGNSYVYENCNHINGNYVDSTNTRMMTNVYHPDDNFYTSLQNCPLNGTWSIEVMDGWSSDNGYVCGWELALNPALVPQNWSYDVTVDTALLLGLGSEGNIAVPTQSGAINYTARVIDNLNCNYDTTMTIVVVQSPKPELGEDVNFCYGDEMIIKSNYSEPNTTYLWNTGDRTEDIEVISAGQYSVQVATSNEDGSLTCRGSDTINVIINEMPLFDYTSSSLEGCAPLTVKFTNNSTPLDAQYEWWILDENARTILSSNQREPTFKIEEPGTYSVCLNATTKEGCTDTLIRWKYLTVHAQPIAEFTPDPEVSLMSENNGEVYFHNYADSTLLTDGSTSFRWDFNDGEMDSTNVSPTHTFAQWGDYDVKLTIETGAGCSDEIVHTVVIEQDLVFPNVITPNGDGYNDVFAIENLNTDINPEDPDKYRNNQLVIFDRWGKRVYEAKNYDTFSRNGTIEVGSKIFDGTGLSDGVYYYSFYYKGKAKVVKYNGSVSIIR